MKILFLGTRANIKKRTKKHFYNASCLVTSRTTCIMIDAGTDWLGKLALIKPQPQAVLITHAHPDHADGLKDGVSCPVYATKATVNLLKKYPIQSRVFTPQRRFKVGSLTIQAFLIDHALHIDVVGYRISDGEKSLFYAPDVVYIQDMHKALHNLDLFIGDGARVRTSRVFKRDNRLFGHASIMAQLKWCQKMQIPCAVFTHCGTQIVADASGKVVKEVVNRAKKMDIKTVIAYDGQLLSV